MFCLDYNADGGQFVTAGKDKVVRLYDEATKSLVLEMQASLFGMNDITGHSNRIFSSRFVHDDQHVVITGAYHTLHDRLPFFTLSSPRSVSRSLLTLSSRISYFPTVTSYTLSCRPSLSHSHFQSFSPFC